VARAWSCTARAQASAAVSDAGGSQPPEQGQAGPSGGDGAVAAGVVQLSETRRALVQKYQGKLLVNIREYYQVSWVERSLCAVLRAAAQSSACH
jgi:Transcriptional Coactivator p15 (PC4)